VIAGADDGAHQTIAPLIAAHDSRMLRVGFLHGDDRAAALAAADVFALPATGEGLSLAALEALAFGVPALLAPGCNFPEAEQAGAAVIVPPDVESIAAALIALFSDSARRTAMSQRGRALVEARYSWTPVLEQIQQVYQALVKDKPV
jgi:glycosyltransferase involved in cell wall biosynthesis